MTKLGPMKSAASFLILTAILWAAGASSAVYLDGNKLNGYCNDEPGFNHGLCYGYLTSVADTVEFIRYALPGATSPTRWDPSDVCIPEGVTTYQLHGVWKNWAAKNPQDLHYMAASLVMNAYAEAWPCPAQ